MIEEMLFRVLESRWLVVLLLLPLISFSVSLMNRWLMVLSRLKILPLLEKRSFLFFVLAFYLVNILDWWLTAVGVSTFGVSAEGNPKVAQVLLEDGFSMLLFYKTPLSLVFLPLLVYFVSALKTIREDRALYRKIAAFNIILFYVFGALIPWSYMLTRYHLEGGSVSLLTPYEAFTFSLAEMAASSSLVF